MTIENSKRLTGVLVSLQHELRDTSMGVPELDSAIFGATHDPVSMWCEGYAEDEILKYNQSPVFEASSPRFESYLVAFKGADTLSAWLGVGVHTRRRGQLPHLDGLVQAAADESITGRCKGNRVDAVCMCIFAFKANDQFTALNIPYSHALVKRSSGNQTIIRGNGDSRNAIFDDQVEHLLVGIKIPQADTPVPAS